jgi:phospholipid transport system transporter-binding protein
LTGAALNESGKGVWRIAGDVDFASVPGLWERLAPLIEKRHKLTLSLRDAGRTNSASLALLLEARGHAQRHGCKLRLRDLPDDLIDLARVSRCEHLLRG